MDRARCHSRRRRVRRREEGLRGSRNELERPRLSRHGVSPVSLVLTTTPPAPVLLLPICSDGRARSIPAGL
jgi:hypothetical protein